MGETTLERLGNVLETVLRVPRASVVAGVRLDELAALDSLSLAELASALDREFEIQVPGEELKTSLTVSQLLALIDASPRAPQPVR